MEFEKIVNRVTILEFWDRENSDLLGEYNKQELLELQTLLKHSEQRGKLLEMLKRVKDNSDPGSQTYINLKQLIKECENESK